MTRYLLHAAILGSVLMTSGTVHAQIYGGRDPYAGRDPYYGRDRDYGRGGGYDGGNNLVRRVQDDVNRALSYDRRGGREYDRFNNAMRHLSEFDANLSRGRFDRGKLDRAIEDVNNIVTHNHIGGRERSILAEDVMRLRDFRARYGNGNYGYRY